MIFIVEVKNLKSITCPEVFGLEKKIAFHLPDCIRGVRYETKVNQEIFLENLNKLLEKFPFKLEYTISNFYFEDSLIVLKNEKVRIVHAEKYFYTITWRD